MAKDLVEANIVDDSEDDKPADFGFIRNNSLETEIAVED